jgi:signal transduction histidine kinase
LVVLIVVAGALGGLWAYFWQQSSQESLRIDSLVFEAQQIRGDLYRQLKEITRSRLIDDPSALNLYWEHLYDIDHLFNQLEQQATGPTEIHAIKTMRTAYELMQTEMNKLFANPHPVDGAIWMHLLDPAYEAWILGDFETAFHRFQQLIARQRQQLEAKFAYWMRLAPILLPIPVLLAVGLLVYSHYRIKRGFAQPMATVTSGARLISQGQLDHAIPEQGVAEVAQLSHSINNMAKDLAASRNALIENERQATLGALVPVVAHNIRNPLASIRAAAQILADTDSRNELRETREDIIETVDRLGRWLGTLLFYLNPLEPQKKPVRLSTVVEGALTPLKTKLEERDLKILRQNWTSDDAVHADIDLLEQAIHGLVNNAIEASPQGAEIRLAIEPQESSVELRIDDQGPGMRDAPQPTDRLPGPTTKRFGTGLGIPFAFKVCQAHGGRLAFEQLTCGGTRVRVIIPVPPSGQLST